MLSDPLGIRLRGYGFVGFVRRGAVFEWGHLYPLVMTVTWLLKMAIEIVSFPISNGDLNHSYVKSLEGNTEVMIHCPLMIEPVGMAYHNPDEDPAVPAILGRKTLCVPGF